MARRPAGPGDQIPRTFPHRLPRPSPRLAIRVEVTAAIRGWRNVGFSDISDAAAERFIDYWMGRGTWKQTPEQRKAPIAASVVNVRRWAHALFTEPTPLGAFRSLDVPVLYMVGKRSTQSAHGVARLLANALPRVDLVEFEDLDHMGSVTHPEPVNRAIAQFLGRV